jgi:16S rRNA (guanine527-N7)-methyltransferase
MTDDALQPLTPPAEFIAAAEAQGIIFDDGDLNTLGTYLAHLLATNRQFNLTAVTDADTAWSRHILDSLALLPFLASAEATNIIDIGSGGGLPGIPLAIVSPDMHFTLLEATGKKARFLQHMVDTLPLSNARVVNDRAEVMAHDRDTHRAQYDIVIARAVGPLPVLLELTIPFAREGGFVLAVKGERAAEEIEQAQQALHLLHAVVAQSVRTPTSTIVVIEKSRTTPRIYPRRPGEPKRAPLGVGSAKGKPA